MDSHPTHIVPFFTRWKVRYTVSTMVNAGIHKHKPYPLSKDTLKRQAKNLECRRSERLQSYYTVLHTKAIREKTWPGPYAEKLFFRWFAFCVARLVEVFFKCLFHQKGDGQQGEPPNQAFRVHSHTSGDVCSN